MASVVAGWLERPTARVGLDNLGAQQPCIAIYSRLLPGITNVTDRAVYFGFYPWFMRTFARRHPDANQNNFRDWLRRADCLVTLVAERHAIKLEDNDAGLHGATCPGRQKLGPAAMAISTGETLRLTDFSRAEDNPRRYFKNPLGGLGQYYLGVLRDEFHVLVGDAGTVVNFTTEHGEPLAELYADGLDEERFFATVERDQISTADLDGLAEFCPCRLHSGARPIAQAALIDLILHGKSLSGLARARTLALLLSFLRAREGAPTKDAVKDFLSACYSGALASGEEWVVPQSLADTRKGWALYLRNEMMSLAWSAIFKAALDELDGTPKPLFNVRAIADWLMAKDTFKYRPPSDFDVVVEGDRATAPRVQDYDDPDHEICFWRELTDGDGSRNVELAARILTRLVARYGEDGSDYAPVRLPPDALSGYPLTLTTLSQFARGRWRGISGEAWMRDLVIQVLVAHQRVAIRKLGLSGEDTLMFRCGDEGVVVQRTLDGVVETQPRLRQALQILRDLGLTEPKPSSLPVLTALGADELGALIND